MQYTKYNRISRNVLLACAFAMPAVGAHAQSNVQIYGLLDLGFVKRSNDKGKVDRGNNNRLGFRGTEDLGNGLSATFHLQTRFNPDTGTQERAAVLWQGETTVGLASKTWGAVRLGRALTPMWQHNWKFEPWGASGFNASLNSFQVSGFSADGTNDTAMGSANFARSPNSVFYNSPTLNGFSLSASAMVDRDANARGRNRGLSLNYDSGPVALMLSGEENTDRDRIGFVAASYNFGPAKVMGSFSRIDHRERDDEKSFVLAATYDIGPGTVRGGFGRNTELDVSRISVGYLYPLSKRTKLYLDGWRHRTPVSATTYNGVALGVNHSF